MIMNSVCFIGLVILYSTSVTLKQGNVNRSTYDPSVPSKSIAPNAIPLMEEYSIPSQVPSADKFHRDVNTFLQENVSDPYKQKGSDPVFVTYVEEVLKKIAGVYESKSYRYLFKQGGHLVSENSNDPVLNFAYGYVAHKCGYDVRANKLYSDIEHSAEYSVVLKFLYQTIIPFKIRSKRIDPGTVKSPAMLHVEQMIDATIITPEQDSLLYFLVDRNFEDLRQFDRLAERADTSVWLKKLIEGRIEIDKAWAARGNGWSSSVTEERWEGFKLHLSRARTLLTEAWTVKPERPEAAVQMINLAKAGHANQGETPVLWFNRAIKADPDYLKAYITMLGAVLPRWGGSLEQIHDLGMTALQSKRHSTGVAQFYIQTLFEISREMPSYSWRTTFRQPAIRQNLEMIFSNMESDPVLSEPKESITALRAVCALYAGEYNKASNLFNEAGKDINYETLLKSYGAKKYLALTRDKIEKELSIGGKYESILNQSYDLVAQNQNNQAVELLKKHLSTIPAEDSDARDYMIDEIGKTFLALPLYEIKRTTNPFFKGLREEKKGTLELMVELNIDLNRVDPTGLTALHALAQNSSAAEQIKFLLQNGADPTIVAHSHYIPLYYAANKNSNIEVLNILIEASSGAPEILRTTALHGAVRAGSLEFTERMLQAGYSPNSRGGLAKSALQKLIHTSGKSEMAELLCKNGADVNLLNRFGESLLDLCKRSDKTEIATVLVRYGAKIGAELTTSENGEDAGFEGVGDGVESSQSRSKNNGSGSYSSQGKRKGKGSGSYSPQGKRKRKGSGSYSPQGKRKKRGSRSYSSQGKRKKRE